MKPFISYFSTSLNKVGEEICGDQVRILRSPGQTRLVLSDGMGSGIKAGILSTLTAEIFTRMLHRNAPLVDVVETVIQTLPLDPIQKVAYATFSIVEVDQTNLSFQIFNFGNPEVLLFRQGKRLALDWIPIDAAGKKILLAQGTLEMGDFLLLLSDGVVGAGPGAVINRYWGLDQISAEVEEVFKYHPSGAKAMVQRVMTRTRDLYAERPGDDASAAGLLIRACQTATIFTGPPTEKKDDRGIVERLMASDGRKIVCGDTSGTIVARLTGQKASSDLSTMREDVPPIGVLAGIDLLTEGIITMSKALQFLENWDGEIRRLPTDRTGPALLVREMLLADEITFFVGMKINPNYQTPLLPQSVSIRKVLVEKICACLEKQDKTVNVEYF